ncbi:MAG: sigma-54-dependent transcriptional regulator [Rhodoferax sp.]
MSAASARLTVLVVDDEPRSLETLRRTLQDDFEVLTASGAQAALELMETEGAQLVLSDQRMPGTSGVALLAQIRQRWPDTVRMILSGHTDAQDIIAGVNEAGIWQYLLKPWHPDQLLLTLQSAAALWRLQQDNQRLTLELRPSTEQLALHVGQLRERAKAQAGFERMVRAEGSPLHAVCELAQRVAGHDLSVLITGESGTGKELLARGIHYASARAQAPFIVENCGALPDTLLESELFGHKRGAFTGATESHTGLFQQAHGGTLFLDEIGETSPAFQVKLLRVLQEGEVRPVGSTRAVPVDVRVLAATNRDLEEEVACGRFREDLYYRIAGITLHMPPLRERVQDITHIVAQMLHSAGALDCSLTPPARECLQRYAWPGNVRELQNEIQRALALREGPVLGVELFSPRLRSNTPPSPVVAQDDPATLREQLERFEAQILRAAMQRHKGNKTHVAQELGLTRLGLRMKLQRLGLE